MAQPQTKTRLKAHRPKALLAIALVTLLGCASLGHLVRAQAEDLTVRASFADKQSVSSNEPIEFHLNRSLQPSEGRLAVFVGQTDMTSLFAASGTGLTYVPRGLPLAQGETEVTVYLVSPDDNWKELARFPLKISAAQSQAQAQSSTTVSSQNNGAIRKWGFDKASVTPSLTIGVKSQVAESHFPDSNLQGRSTYTDVTLQGNIQSDLTRGLFNSQSQYDIVGTSYKNEALRFAQDGERAPRIDLSSYLMQFQMGKVKAMVGHVSLGAFRHLMNGYSSRGITLTVPITSRADFSAGAMNGTSIVGWSNFFGLNRRKHQIATAILGYEFDRERPGGIRLEAGLLYGSLKPISNFNQGSVADAERSRGLGFRFIASDRAQRFRLDSGFARSNFDNPADPLLNQGFNVVTVRESARNARYVDASYDILKGVRIGQTKQANLTFTYRHETIDPLFRSVAAFNQADRFQNQFEAVASVADISATVVYNRFNDNLDDIPSILKTLSRRSGVIIGAPLVSIFGDSSKPSEWYPRLSYSFDRMRQFGAGLPVNSGFSASHVPDQVSLNHGFGAEWQAAKWRFGYRLNNSFQDNRQIGRELADLSNWVNGFAFGYMPASAVDLSFDLSLERARNREQNRTDNTDRIGTTINWRMTGNATLATTVSTIFAGDIAGTSDSRNIEFDLQWSYRFTLEKSRYQKVQGQFFARYANRYARALDNLFGFRTLTRLQTFNVGLSFTFF